MHFVRKRWWPRFIDLASIFVLVFTIMAAAAETRQHIAFTTGDEKYDPRLAYLDSVDAVAAEARRRAPGGNARAQAAAVEELLRYRFYHGYSRYDFADNWALWIAARIVHPHLDAKVFADDILQHPWAACSQQAIVTQAVLNRLGIRTATVEWPAHFTAAAFIDNDWFIVDPWGPMERNRTRLWRYADWVDKEKRAHILGPNAAAFDRDITAQPPRLTKIGEFPAPTMAWFHPLTKALSDWLWVVAFGWLSARVHSRRTRSPRLMPALARIT